MYINCFYKLTYQYAYDYYLRTTYTNYYILIYCLSYACCRRKLDIVYTVISVNSHIRVNTSFNTCYKLAKLLKINKHEFINLRV